MKILHIIPSLDKGGAERLCLDICNALSKEEGIEVRLITFSNINGYPLLTESIDWKIIPSDVRLSVLRKNRYNVTHLQETISDFKPDIIHTHLFEAELVSRAVLYPAAKWFSHCHDNMVQFQNFGLETFLRKLNLTNYFEKKVLFPRYKKNGGTHFIAISKDTERYFKKTAKPYPVYLLPNAIDYHKFSIPVLKNPDNILHLINIGSFAERKNQTFLLDVALELNRREYPFELHLVGDGLKRSLVETKARNLGLEKKVVFHGMVDQVEKILWQSDIYVHSALSEGLSLTTLEAMAAGLPVITLDGKGNRDLIVQGKNGFMLFEQDAKKFAEKVMEVWENRKLYREMSGFATQFAKGFDIKEYVDRLLEIYKQAL